MLNKDRELAYLRTAVPLLGKYLLARDAAWLLPGIAGDGGQPYTMLTLGPVLLILKRLKARGLGGSELEELGQYEEQIFQDKIHNENAWKKKAGQDTGSRLRLWQAAFDDYKKDPQAFVSAYPALVGQRVMLQLLLEELEPLGLLSTPMQFTLQMADTGMKLFFQPCPFIWEQELQRSFPEELYWYLYGNMQEKVNFK
jgi:hypothetical protein